MKEGGGGEGVGKDLTFMKANRPKSPTNYIT